MIVLFVILLCSQLYLLALMGRQEHPGWKRLEGVRYAHRGLHGNGVAENSMTAFRLAVEKGYGIELDIHLLADGTLAVIHDGTLLRTTGCDGKVENLTLADLQNYHLEGTEDTIPTFRQVLELVNGKVPLIVELKSVDNNFAALTDAACDLLKVYSGAYCMESFDPRCIHHLRKHHPYVIRGQLAENFFKSKVNISWKHKLCMTCQLTNFLTQPDFVAYRFADRKRPGIFLVRKFWKLHTVGWTIKTPEDLHRAEKENWLPIFEGFEP